jgi:hypothetical protein
MPSALVFILLKSAFKHTKLSSQCGEFHKLRPEEITSRDGANKKPLKPKADDQSHKPAKHIEETARLASSIEKAKDPGKVRRTKD